MASPVVVESFETPPSGVIDDAYLTALLEHPAAAEAIALPPAAPEETAAATDLGSAFDRRMALAVMDYANRGEGWRAYRQQLTANRRAAVAQIPTTRNKAKFYGALALSTFGGLVLAGVAMRLGTGATHVGDLHLAVGTGHDNDVSMETVSYEVEHNPNTEPTTVVLPEWDEKTGRGSIWNEMPNIAAILGYPDIPTDIQDGLCDFVRGYNNLSEEDAEGIKEFKMPPRNDVDAKLQELGAEFDKDTAEPGTPRNPIVEAEDPVDQSKDPAPAKESPEPVVLPPHYEEPGVWDKTKDLWDKSKDTILTTAVLAGGLMLTIFGAAALTRAARGRRTPRPDLVPEQPKRRLVGFRRNDRSGGRVGGGGASPASTAAIEAAVGSAHAPNEVDPTPEEEAAAAAAGLTDNEPTTYGQPAITETPDPDGSHQRAAEDLKDARQEEERLDAIHGETDIQPETDVDPAGGDVGIGEPDDSPVTATSLPVLPPTGPLQVIDRDEIERRIAAAADAARKADNT